MQNPFSRTELLLGKEAVDLLRNSRVAVFGIGGVGGFVVEALARSGVGSFELIDNDKVCLSNINRQIIATQKTIGQYKCDVMKERILEINPEAEVRVRNCFYLPENAKEFDFSSYSYVVDAIDTVTAKIDIVLRAQACGVPVMSSMGAGNKLNPTMFEVADLYETSIDPLARVMRRELKKRGVQKLKVVYSKEKALRPLGGAYEESDGSQNKKRVTPGSTAFVPSVAGLIIASEVIKDLTKEALQRARAEVEE